MSLGKGKPISSHRGGKVASSGQDDSKRVSARSVALSIYDHIIHFHQQDSTLF